MLIFWGTRASARYAGRMAEFCLVCRDAVVVDVTEHYSYRHVYFIPTSRRDYQVFETTCRECGLRRLRPWSEMRTTVKQKSIDMNGIIAATQGDFERLIRPRVEREAELRRSNQAGQRISEVAELVVALDHTFRRTIERPLSNPVLMFLGLGGIAGVIGSFVYATRMPSRDMAAAVPWFWLEAGLYFVLVWFVYRWSKQRAFDRRITPLLRQSLQKMHARQSELEAVIAALTPQKLATLHYIRPTDVLSSMS